MRLGFFLLPVLLSAAIASATVLFQDDFSAGTGNWEIIPTGVPPETSSTGGYFTVTNNTASPVLLRHWLTISNFSFSVTATALCTTFTQIGLVCCLNDVQGYYVVFDSEQRFKVFKYTETPQGLIVTQSLVAIPSSYVFSKINRLTVSKTGSEMSFFCNGKYLTTITDATYPSGNIALVVSGKAAARFDDVLVTSEPTPVQPSLCFSDDFADGNLLGWYIGFADTVQATTSAMTVKSAAGGSSNVVYATGDFDSCAMRAIVFCDTVASASKNGMYGLTLVDIIQDTAQHATYRNLSFAINARHQYAIILPDSTRFQLFSDNGVLHAPQGSDTLMVVVRGSNYVFLANGDTLARTPLLAASQLVCEGAGLMLTPGLSIRCSWFGVNRNESFICPVRNPVRQAYLSQGSSFGAPRLACDARGRIHALGIANQLKHSSGILFSWGINNAKANMTLISVPKHIPQ
jgi:hypothetical protein